MDEREISVSENLASCISQKRHGLLFTVIQRSKIRLYPNNESEIIWLSSKYYIDILIQVMEKKHGKSELGKSVTGPRFEPSISKIRGCGPVHLTSTFGLFVYRYGRSVCVCAVVHTRGNSVIITCSLFVKTFSAPQYNRNYSPAVRPV